MRSTAAPVTELNSAEFYVRLTVQLELMNNNQLDALFIFSLLGYHTATCFGRISSPSSGGRMYIYVANGTGYTSELTGQAR
jgi:hypothetical protein